MFNVVDKQTTTKHANRDLNRLSGIDTLPGNIVKKPPMSTLNRNKSASYMGAS